MRFNDFIKSYELLNENQAWFRAGYSTTDHIFSLHALIDLLKLKKKKKKKNNNKKQKQKKKNECPVFHRF